MAQQYSKKQLSELAKKDVYVIARKLSDTLPAPQPGISKYSKPQLIDYILKAQKMLEAQVEQPVDVEVTLEQPVEADVEVTVEQPVDVEEAQAQTEAIPNPKEFFEIVKALTTKLEVSRACNNLLDQLNAHYTVATVSKKLSGYKKIFYGYQSDIEELNELAEVKGVSKKQHIAANLLSIDSDQSKELRQQRELSKQLKAGYTEEGNVKKVSMPVKNPENYVPKACELITGEKPETITSGMLLLTGLRKNEQQLKEVVYTDIIDGKEIDREPVKRKWKVVGEYLLAIKSLSKKGGSEGWFVRITLAPAELLLEAQERFWSFIKVQKQPKKISEYENKGLRKSTDRKFKELWGSEFATIEAYDSKGNLITNNGSPHKARAVYAWMVLLILKNKGASENQARMYLQKCLGHEDESATSKYLRRYSEADFGVGIELDIPLNINAVGEKSEEEILELAEAWEEEKALQLAEEREELLDNIASNFEQKESKSQQQNLPKQLQFDQYEFLDLLDDDIQISFGSFLNTEKDITKALAAFANALNKKIPKPKNKKPTKHEIEEVLAYILDYNSQQPDLTDTVFPSWNLINLISKKINGKTFDRNTTQQVLLEKHDSINSNFLRHNKSQQELEKWNLRHRGKMDDVVDKIVELILYSQ